MTAANKNKEHCCLASAWALLVRGWRAYGEWCEKSKQEAFARWLEEDEREAAKAKITILRGGNDNNWPVPLTPPELLTITTFPHCYEIVWRDKVKNITVIPVRSLIPGAQLVCGIEPPPLYGPDHMKRRVRQAIAAARRDGLL